MSASECVAAREPLSYSSLFRQSWRNLLVAALASALAIGVFALLQLWAELFAIIGIDAFRSLFREPWFLFPVFALSFGLGVHVFRGLARIIDTLTGIIEGLLRLLLPLLAALIAMFLAALLFTGLAPLWNTGSGTALLMALNVLALIFLNGVYQTGEAREPSAWGHSGYIESFLAICERVEQVSASFELRDCIRLGNHVCGERQMSFYSCHPFAQVPQIAADSVQTAVHLREALVHLREARVHCRKAAAEFGPDIGHVTSLLCLRLKKHPEQQGHCGHGRGYLSCADPCLLAHWPTLMVSNTVENTMRGLSDRTEILSESFTNRVSNMLRF